MRLWRAFVGGMVAVTPPVIAAAGHQTVSAQERSARIDFNPGQTRGSVRGNDDLDYRANLRGGQQLTLTKNTSDSGDHFDRLDPNGSEMRFNGSIFGEVGDG